MTDTVIRIENLSKQYRLGEISGKTLRDELSRWWAKTTGKPNPLLKIGQQAVPTNGQADSIWALKDVSFEVKRGEVLGIIGRNGAGKSTLLKILSRVTSPTSGNVFVRGRIASLLEVGTGFHPELTGRENIYLNGAILGMTKTEIRSKFDEIVAFAEVEKFIDTPVKRYSSGMYVRLAFAVAAHLEPEILIVDEVLAVGDAEFQKKCLGKMGEVAAEGRTVLFVSHNLNAVRSLCTKSIVLSEGHMTFLGDSHAAINFYVEAPGYGAGTSWKLAAIPRAKNIFFESIGLTLAGKQPEIKLLSEVTIRCVRAAADCFLAVDICDKTHTPIMQAIPNVKPFIRGIVGTHHVRIEIDLPPLVPGRYTVDFWIGPHNSRTFDSLHRSLAVEIVESPSKDRIFPHSGDHGFMVPNSHCTYSQHVEQLLQ